MVGSRLNQIAGRRLIAVTTAVLVSVLAGSAAAASAEPAAHPGTGQASGGPSLAWLPGRGALAPQPGSADRLEGVFCTSAASCWAVGYFERSGAWLNETLRWNGHHWSLAAVPDNVQSSSDALPANCWAIGHLGSLDDVAPVLNQALHWDGSAWSVASVPSPGGSADGDHSFLYGIRCTSRTNCWAVGQAQPSGKAGRNELVHWNGTKWSAA